MYMIYSLNSYTLELPQIHSSSRFRLQIQKIVNSVARLKLSNMHLMCERTTEFWNEVRIWLQNLGFRNFRIGQKIILMGDSEFDRLFNLCTLIGKKTNISKKS